MDQVDSCINTIKLKTLLIKIIKQIMIQRNPRRIQTISTFMVWKISVYNFKNGFKQSNCDYSLFLRKTFKGFSILLLEVDDILIYGDDKFGNASLKRILQSSFHKKDIGHLTFFLGLVITIFDIFLFQHKYEGFMEAKRKHLLKFLDLDLI